MNVTKEILEGIIRKVLSESKSVTLIQFKEEYIESIKHTHSVSYLKSVRFSFDQLIKHCDNIQLQKIDVKTVDGFFNKNYKRAKYSAALYHRTLKAAFNKAQDWDYISNNPFMKIKIPRHQIERPKFICYDELNTILQFVSDHLKGIYELAFLTGLRLSEIINLKWTNVNLDEKVLQIGDSQFTTKSKQIRFVPLSGKAYKILLNKSINVKKNKTGFVFCKIGNSYPFTANYISKQFKKASRQAGVDEKVHFHSLRHSFASNLVKRGVPLYHIKELLGHSSVAVTEIYSHLNIESLHEAVNKL